jgi:hypothetical protein
MLLGTLACFLISNRTGHWLSAVKARVWGLLVCFLLGWLTSCSSAPPGSSGESRSPISWTAIEDGEIWFRNSEIQLRFDGEMYCRVFLQKDGKLYSINDIPPDAAKAKPPHFLIAGGEEIKDFRVDYRNVGVSELKTRFGVGKRLHLIGYAATSQGIEIEKNLAVELYQDYPNIAIVSVTYRNTDSRVSIPIASVASSFFRMDASRSEPNTQPYAFWIFLGEGAAGSGASSVQRVDAHYSRTIRFDEGPDPANQAIPLIDFWTSRMGMAISDLSLIATGSAAKLSIAADQKLEVVFHTPSPDKLDPDETFTSSSMVWMVHTGDFQSALQRYKQMLLKEASGQRKPA